MRPGTSWGVRTWPQRELLFQVDGNNNLINIYDTTEVASELSLCVSVYCGRHAKVCSSRACTVDCTQVTSSGPGPCVILQTLHIAPATCNTPHELGVDERTGALYVACVGWPGSNLLRFVLG